MAKKVKEEKHEIVEVKTVRLEGRDEAVEEAVLEVIEEGNTPIVSAQSVVGGPTVELFLSKNIKMFDQEHGGIADMPEADRVIDLTGATVPEEPAEEEEEKPVTSKTSKETATK